MKVKKNIEFTTEVKNALLGLLSYSVADIESYDELTDSEKDIISEELFNQLVEED